MVYLEAQGDGAVFSSLANGPHPLYVPLLMLVLDCVLYLLLAIYLDQVVPGKYKKNHCPLYRVCSLLQNPSMLLLCAVLLCIF